jgi:hypothetical protein
MKNYLQTSPLRDLHTQNDRAYSQARVTRSIPSGRPARPTSEPRARGLPRHPGPIVTAAVSQALPSTALPDRASSPGIPQDRYRGGLQVDQLTRVGCVCQTGRGFRRAQGFLCFRDPMFPHDEQQGRMSSTRFSHLPSSNARSLASAFATRSRFNRARPHHH